MENQNTRVLLIGRADGSAAGVADALALHGYETLTIDAGQLPSQALHNFDLALVQASLSDVAAADLVARLKSIEGGASLPVIVFGEIDALPSIETYLRQGVDDYLLMPVTPGMAQARIARVLEHARERREEAQRLRNELLVKIEHDIEVARSIQAGFLPQQLPQQVGWDIAAYFRPAREVAGDFYDAFTILQGRRVALVIGDVVDKGIPAALFMALVRSLTRAFAQQNYSLSWADVLDDGPVRSTKRGQRGQAPTTGTTSLRNAVLLTNNYILDNHEDLNYFATLFFGMLDPGTGQLAYINAGHNPPFVAAADGTIRAELKGTGPAVGIFRGADFRIGYAQLEPGEILLTYTDGVTEAHGASKEFYGEERLRTILSRPHQSAADLLAEIARSIDELMAGSPQFDDITMLAVRRIPVM
jgi:sigma-B regulation protein RsbU (phosphoserine phosphatase)